MIDTLQDIAKVMAALAVIPLSAIVITVTILFLIEIVKNGFFDD